MAEALFDQTMARNLLGFYCDIVLLNTLAFLHLLIQGLKIMTHFFETSLKDRGRLLLTSFAFNDNDST